MTDYTLGNENILTVGTSDIRTPDNKTLPTKTSKKEENNITVEVPSGWDKEAFTLWHEGQRQSAIERTVKLLNTYEKEIKPKALLLQLAYYLFLLPDYISASKIFQQAHESYPDDNEITTNLAVTLSRAGDYKGSIKYITKVLKAEPSNYIGWDSVASSYYNINEKEKASKAGTNSLRIKDKLYGKLNEKWVLPDISIKEFTQNKKKVIAFSLWGNEKRYIFGALRNLLLAPDIYPGWELWFYVDNTVSAGFLQIIQQLGGRLIQNEENQNYKEKLCRRFNVANDPDVGYFLVRDIDSVFSVREQNAVQEWVQSDKWFHVIRDWWTHTDLILAGAWGGIANTLPDIQVMMEEYSSDKIITPNIDQWFLRDCIWRYIKVSCLVHDRCFSHDNPLPIPGRDPIGIEHIGSCEYQQRPKFQEAILAAWIKLGQEQK